MTPSTGTTVAQRTPRLVDPPWVVASPAQPARQPVVPVVAEAPPPAAPELLADLNRSLPRRVLPWALAGVFGLFVVLYALSPILQQRNQHKLFVKYRTEVRNSSLQSTGLAGVELPTRPPPTGSAVGIVEIGRTRLQQVVVEGVGPAETENGPGHVPGTAGLGQPGNAAIVGRNKMFGGPFSGLPSLHKGDAIVATTIEGQSVYRVSQVARTSVHPGGSGGSSLPTNGSSTQAGPKAPDKIPSSIGADDLFGPSTDNRLTLVTSASVVPWNTREATVVIAKMETQPFVPTHQQASSSDAQGRSGASGALAPFVLALAFFLAVVFGVVVLYRRTTARSAYLVTTPPLMVAMIVLAVALSHFLPAWT